MWCDMGHSMCSERDSGRLIVSQRLENSDGPSKTLSREDGVSLCFPMGQDLIHEGSCVFVVIESEKPSKVKDPSNQ